MLSFNFRVYLSSLIQNEGVYRCKDLDTVIFRVIDYLNIFLFAPPLSSATTTIRPSGDVIVSFRVYLKLFFQNE
ncbi:hypothetical protein L1987_16282 [Smallanthus sonchifolius]|uniref:Uncharacterized protein n=1 Tax=Smallanthus sonchifolius TaxID=185202 RepID=A0ACB9JA16_9ASTR|nr:hypothetical protein L1987_16282 [Smallanthus sonchifolius]